MQSEVDSPLFALAGSLAYEIQADHETSPQEKAKLITLFGKLVESNVMSAAELNTMVQRSFTYASTIDIDTFIETASPILTDAQKLAIIINLYDVMQIDGHINSGERATVKKFQIAFNIDEVSTRGINRFLMLKNDTTLFLNKAHPLNNTYFGIEDLFRDS
ncbi:MAG: TerB family tellurite resistance protein [Rhodospirillales bacterium]|jgi:uncharacterized tellurite resistance protein B-like protein|nr:TerB family tellurite resistance protein [Rhodospirillales bacterium]